MSETPKWVVDAADADRGISWRLEKPASPPSPAAAPAKWNLDEWLTRETQHSSDCTANERRVGYNADCICGAWRFVALNESRRTLQGELEERRGQTTTLRSALENWGRHFAWCKRSAWTDAEREKPCTCGLDAAIAATRACPKCGKVLCTFGVLLVCIGCGHEEPRAALSPKDGAGATPSDGRPA